MRSVSLPGLLVALAAAWSCSSSVSGPGGATSSSGAGGSGGASTGSGFPPPVSDGAFSLQTSQPDATTCQIFGNMAQVGDVTPENRLMVVTNGSGGTKVACAVTGSGTFAVDATLDDTANTGNFLEIHIPSIAPAASMSAPAPGSASFAAEWTAGNELAGACSFYFMAPETVDTGKIWVSFNCPGLATNGDTSMCPVTQAVAMFEKCATQ